MQENTGPNDGTFIKIGDPDDVTIDHNTVFQSGPVTWAYGIVNNIAITNNIFNCFVSDGGYQGIYGPGFGQGGNGPMGAYFPGITDPRLGFHKNVLIGGDPAKYSNYNTLSQNYFPANAAAVNFEDYPNGINDYHNYRLDAASAYNNNATDGGDIGVDFVRLDIALNKPPLCAPLVPAIDLPHEINIRIFPNPFHAGATLVSNIELKDAVLILCNTLGQEVRRVSGINGHQVNMAMDDLPAGIYFPVLLQADKTIMLEKWMGE